MEKENLILIFVIAIMSLVLVLITYGGATNSWEREAIKEGHAEYYLDKDFNRQWRWLPVTKIEKTK